MERLLEAQNAAALNAWVKAPDVGFYTIEYGFQPGGNGRSKRGQFKPDFFLLWEEADEVIVVETKADDINAGSSLTRDDTLSGFVSTLQAALSV